MKSLEDLSFDDVITADRRTHESILRRGSTPTTEQLAGWEFRGFNPMPITRFIGIQKFMKGFFLDEAGQLAGYNLIVEAPWAGPRAPWVPRWGGSKKARHGYYDVQPVGAGRYGDYANAVLLDYGSGRNALWNPERHIRDFLVVVRAAEPTLLLGKAYIDLFGAGRAHSNFFVLERLRRVAS